MCACNIFIICLLIKNIFFTTFIFSLSLSPLFGSWLKQQKDGAQRARQHCCYCLTRFFPKATSEFASERPSWRKTPEARIWANTKKDTSKRFTALINQFTLFLFSFFLNFSYTFYILYLFSLQHFQPELEEEIKQREKNIKKDERIAKATEKWNVLLTKKTTDWTSAYFFNQIFSTSILVSYFSFHSTYQHIFSSQ